MKQHIQTCYTFKDKTYTLETHCSYIHICQHLNMYIQYTRIYSYVYRHIRGGINSAINKSSSEATPSGSMLAGRNMVQWPGTNRNHSPHASHSVTSLYLVQVLQRCNTTAVLQHCVVQLLLPVSNYGPDIYAITFSISDGGTDIYRDALTHVTKTAI